MSTSENPETPPLTRRQLRELRNTGATPIINPQFDADDAAPTEPPAAADATDAPAAAVTAAEETDTTASDRKSTRLNSSHD